MCYAQPMSSALDSYVAAWKERHRKDTEAGRRRAVAARERLPLAIAELRRLGATRIWLFGSLCRGALRADSDIDLCVEDLPVEALSDAHESLEALLERRVDLVRWEAAPPHWRQAIEQWGELL
jgi:predicted nucleotidyltransferase